MDQTEQIKMIRSLVGEVTDSQLSGMRKKIEMYLTSNLGIFVPFLGHCDYAITPKHTHPGYSFICSFNGPAEVRVRGTAKRSPFGNRANICAFSPNVPHEEVEEDQFRSYIAVCIRKEFYEKELKRYGEIDKTFEGEYFPGNETIITVLKRFIAEYEERLPGRDVMLDAIATEVVNLMIRHCHGIKGNESRISRRIEINQLINRMNESFAERMSIDDMAKIVNLSQSHLTRVFKKETGSTPTDYLINLRVQKAKKYLLDPNHSITDVALNCGFSSSAYFSTCFVERTGLTPSDFRKRQGAI